ncbi:MAG: hypothetical protein EOO73_13015 [Myxococcales bacterium]|nr:MAG: hypothetical protein EOO73_13015 [Myxococcales bacterium]
MRRRWPVSLLLTLGGVPLGGCDRTVTSVGAWSPALQPEPGAAGAANGGAGGAASGGLYLEAESGELSGDFSVGSDAAASNGQYLLAPDVATAEDQESPAQARYAFSVPVDGDYLIWGRIYSPDISSNRFHVQVDGGVRYLWRITVGDLWYWDDIHDDLKYNEPLHFQLAAGAHELVIGNVAAGARLDRLYITATGDEPPGNDTKCRPPHSIDLGGVCHESCGAQATPERGTTCSCAAAPESERFEAYDCGGGSCCFVPAMP